MSAVTTTVSSTTSLIASLSAYVVSPPPSNTIQVVSPADAAAGGDRGAATNVDLSDNVKATLAKAKTDQVAADQLQDFVTSRHVDGGNGNGSSGSQPSGDTSTIDKSFEQLSGAGAAAADDAGTLEPVQVVKSFSTGLQADGFSIAARANAHTGSSDIEIIGPGGFSFYDKKFGPSAEATGALSGGSSFSSAEFQTGNVEYVTLSRNQATAESVTASSGGNVTSASAVSAQSESVTIAIDFTTGSISLVHSQASLTSTSTGQSRSPFSIQA